MSRRRIYAPIVVAGAALAGLAVAQTKSGPLPVLHEDLPSPTGDKLGPVIGAGSNGAPSTAIRSADKTIVRPRDRSRTQQDPVMGKGGFAADRQTTMKADINTGTDGTLHYVSVFNPDVIPFKRMSSLDGVIDDFTLTVAHSPLSEISVGGSVTKGREPFYGSVWIQLTPGADVPLPSVAPDMRILAYTVNPSTRLKFSKDGADNFYVRSDESSANGTFFLRYDVDADSRYFSAELPTGRRYTPNQVAAQTPPELKIDLPPAVRESAMKELAHLNVDATMELGVAFNALVNEFRGFEAKPLPAQTGNIYADLCNSKAVFCRHRSFAFMITANALGIPTRYVQNEAHAFAEVWFPEKGWTRIDLGGAALRMEVTGAEDKTLHSHPEDHFAKPKEYTNSYTQLEGDIRGLTSQQLADKKRPYDETHADAAGSGSGKLPDRITPDPSLPSVTQDPKKQTPKLEITLADSSAFRGAVVHVEGRVATPSGKPIQDHPVDVFLAPAGRSGANPISLGRAVTDAAGTFRQDFTVPGQLNLATYEIYLASPEDAYFNASLSN
ncbi:hypothetical protein BH11MYX2_BH11MYX2_38750 [soil metagenome]